MTLGLRLIRAMVVLLAAILGASCGGADGAADEDAGVVGPPPGGDWNGFPDRDRTSPKPPTALTGGCTPGATNPCTCTTPTGGTVDGNQMCTPDGLWTACGCSGEWPWLGPSCAGGTVECEPLIGEATDFAGAHCCTDEDDVATGRATATDLCGLGKATAFGDHGEDVFNKRPNCFERNMYPAGKVIAECAGVSVPVLPFIELVNCCRPDGACGFHLNYPNWEDLGCIERTEMADRLRQNALLVFFLTFIEGRPELLGNLANDPGTCVYE